MSILETQPNDLGVSGSHPDAELVAAIVAGIPTIGEACRALSAVGWQSKVAGNRISVNDRVFVRYIYETAGSTGSPDTRWVVYGVGDRPVVRIVVASHGQGT
jgi:hypothetical protein